jgi:hypothetical protein
MLDMEIFKRKMANEVALKKCVFIAHEISFEINTKATAMISRTIIFRTYAKILMSVKVK